MICQVMNLTTIAARVASMNYRVGAVPQASGSSYGNTPEIEEAIYGHSGGEQDPNMQGSSIWWLVFNKIGVEDWTPVTKYDAIENAAKELLAEWSKGWHESFTPEEKQERINDSLRDLKENWNSYQKNYMPEHVTILKEKGLM